MKANRRFIEGEEEAVSAVIGVILMVAITVAIAATVYVYVSGMIGGTTTTSSTVAMNVFDRDTSAYQVIWMVSQVEGETIGSTEYRWTLLDTNGQNVTGATLSFNDNNADTYVNSGDTFAVNTTSTGSYVFTLSDSGTGALLFKSATTKY
ncbi:MAG: type IV pilin N-terminal domain-containing protein [Thermoplasmatales archaeon]|nr:MAG: type IV pilin N-terminal domain-containing protein [Thermoplasmatales archaeon]